MKCDTQLNTFSLYDIAKSSHLSPRAGPESASLFLTRNDKITYNDISDDLCFLQVEIFFFFQLCWPAARQGCRADAIQECIKTRNKIDAIRLLLSFALPVLGTGMQKSLEVFTETDYESTDMLRLFTSSTCLC